jgi:hypothetical protein
MNQSDENARDDIGHAKKPREPRRPSFKESGARPESSGDGQALSCTKCVEMGEARMKFGLRWKNDRAVWGELQKD